MMSQYFSIVQKSGRTGRFGPQLTSSKNRISGCSQSHSGWRSYQIQSGWLNITTTSSFGRSPIISLCARKDQPTASEPEQRGDVLSPVIGRLMNIAGACPSSLSTSS